MKNTIVENNVCGKTWEEHEKAQIPGGNEIAIVCGQLVAKSAD
jgi:hypothetical protein